ncbi:MAG: DUF2791 family P-loop domain-containing protein [Anaerolineae bacterium]|nr:DUF2791 family P-loop domain-containing protein [Anaerolineae bacterium]
MTKPNLRAVVAEAKRKGYFDFSDYPKLRLSPPELGELMKLLEKNHVPFGAPEVEVSPITQLSKKEAVNIINALRRGIPAIEGIGYYSVGRDELLRQITKNLDAVASGKSLVRFLNADVGQGKTHTLYMLREFAFKHDFAVSIVTLSQNSCPLYDFMAVYHDIMWELRTSDQRRKPALSNIIDRWVEDIRFFGETRIRQIVHDELPPNLREIMAAYVASTNLFRPNETNRQLILKYLGGEKIGQPDLRRLEINFRLDNRNALQILSEMATTIGYIGFKGVCILFDEAEAIHSFAYSSQRDKAYENLQQIIEQSRQFPHCYFIYATTPSFFDSYGSNWLLQQAGANSVFELGPLTTDEKQHMGDKIAEIYTIGTDWSVSPNVLKAIYKVANLTAGQRLGDFVRQVVGILDEARAIA